MKKILFILIGIIVLGCSGRELEHKIIISKSNQSFTGQPLEQDWCRFFYKSHEHGDWIEFRDYCNKYQVGDTIHGLTHQPNK